MKNGTRCPVFIWFYTKPKGKEKQNVKVTETNIIKYLKFLLINFAYC